VVQKFLSMIAASIVPGYLYNKEVELLVPVPHLAKVLKLLVNPSVTELDCTAFDKYSDGRRTFNKVLLLHALKNCPRISKIEFRNIDTWNPANISLGVWHFKKSWDNLKSIKTQADYLFDEDSLKFIQENIQNIESVSLNSLLLKRQHFFNIFINSQGVTHCRD
jgi:hypothetical protein